MRTVPKLELKCAICETVFLRQRSWAKKNREQFYCSGIRRGQAWAKLGSTGRAHWTDESRQNYKTKITGPLNPAWKGGVTYFKTHGNYQGVRYVRAPEWARPMARADGYVMEHRLIMAEWCGFLLTRTEVVNHLDHNPGNNTRTNLELWPTNADHKRGEVGRCVPGVANRISLALGPL